MQTTLTNLTTSDYPTVITQLNAWWGGRNMTDMLPRLFFKHFTETSFALRSSDQLLGFITGFVSQTDPQKAYVHFIGVNPECRGQNIGRQLYEAFFDAVKKQGVQSVECVTAPINETSIQFHTRLGFVAQPGNALTKQGVPYRTHYDGPDEHRVVFVKKLSH